MLRNKKTHYILVDEAGQMGLKSDSGKNPEWTNLRPHMYYIEDSKLKDFMLFKTSAAVEKKIKELKLNPGVHSAQKILIKTVWEYEF